MQFVSVYIFFYIFNLQRMCNISCDTGTSELGRVCYGDARRHMTGYVTPQQ